MNYDDSPSASTVDRNGHLVHVGNRVRMVRLPEHFLATLPESSRTHYRPLIEEVVDDVFFVQKIDEQGVVWVGQGWMQPDGSCDDLELGLGSDDIEYFDEG